MKKISKVDAYAGMSAIDQMVMDQEVQAVFESDQRNGRKMTDQFFLDKDGFLFLEMYWDGVLVQTLCFGKPKMKIVPNDYCNECRRNTHLIVTGEDEQSIFATCPHCDAKFDLINDGARTKEVAEHKPISERIAFYTKKVAERFSVHPAKDMPRKYTFRHERLMAYKKRMHELFADQGY
ncbi:hypothetical protein KHA94_16445 [Bacillus sp. FJAT-49705]|uniref:Uncharacterized protein n=1 Tax=Cytobacillus citreus TaxID=2833586 RepID=A0ABS5NW00_9BACI|nr:hypothetical protein [Cytobacillus citreus]MBS4191781.1 hypothetical protein [Cytobacillus citreus]